MLSNDADASVVVAGSLNDSNNEADAGADETAADVSGPGECYDA